MMGCLGDEHVNTLIAARNSREQRGKRLQSGVKRLLESGFLSKFIIPPNNYWNMVLNNIIVCFFIVYMALLPLFVSFDTTLSPKHLQILMIFDVFFIIDRTLDLLVGFYREDGQLEHRLVPVIVNNISYKVFFEIFMSFGAYMFDIYNMNSVIYAFFKLPRWLRLFELE